MTRIHHGFGHFLDHISEGWRHIREKATHALTHFHPHKADTNVETADDQLMLGSSRWALLAAEVSETANKVSVRLEVPGMEKDDFDIEVEDNQLVVRGEKHVERTEKKGHYHIKECAYGSFQRVIPLPVQVDSSGANASYLNGVLVLNLPKLNPQKSRKIEVTQA